MSLEAAVRHPATAAVSQLHHESHQHLLNRRPDAEPSSSATVDAIIVPTARHPKSMRMAIELAAQLGCILVALCSKWSTARAVAKLAREIGAQHVAIDVDQVEFPNGLTPRFETTTMLTETVFERKTDTSRKRNIGLLIAHLIGWERVVFLDDDIYVEDPDHLRAAVALLDNNAAVGMFIDGMPDNSVVCHAYRAVGGPQDTFVGGGALAVGPGSMTSFFPNIYNEDWFFLLDDVKLRPTAVTGYVKQKEYDPFASDHRARSEEFGDCLAEGIFSLLDLGRRVQDADTDYWRDFLSRRKAFIDKVISGVPLQDHKTADEKQRMIAALKAASGRCQRITPELCVDYLRAWRSDRTRWRKWLQQLDKVALVPHLDKAASGSYERPVRRLTST